MSRGRRRPRQAAAVSLFPFLAVLLCTMGALIVLLVVIARQAEAHARREHLAAAAEKDLEDEARRRAQAAAQESLDQQAADLRSRYQSISTTLREKQNAAARLKAELEAAQQDLRKLQHQRDHLLTSSGGRPPDEELRRRLADLDERLRQARAILIDRQRAAAAPPQEVYSIVPYAGRNGEARRPIYIECRNDRVILQPEGIELPASDFEVLGPGNPLEAAVRVAASHWEKKHGAAAGNPYPLLLVRPDGVQAYHAAREALSTWGKEFGYELVDQQWTLAYGSPDPQLAAQQQNAIALAREQMELLAKSQSRSRRSSPSFRVSATGSLERLGTENEEEGPFVGRGNRGSRGDSASRSFSGSSRSTNPTDEDIGNRIGSAVPLPGEASSIFSRGNSSSSDPLGSRFAESPSQRPFGEPDSAADVGNRPPLGRSGEPGFGLPGQTAKSASAFGRVGSQLDRLRAVDRSTHRGHAAGTSGNDTSGSGDGHGGHGRSTVQGPRADMRSPAGPAGTSFGSTMPSRASHGSIGQEGPAGMPQDATGDVSFSANLPVAPLATKQGANWALPAKPGRGSSPLRRDVHIIVDEGAITVFVDPRTSQTLQIIRLGPDPAESAAELKEAVGKVMRDWGNPPAGFHWRPVLRTEVTHRGAARFAQLETLLQDSGLELTTRR